MTLAVEVHGECGRCGWPHQEPTCPACGQAAGTRSETADLAHPARQGPRAEDHPELRGAFQAWTSKDWMRLMSQCFGLLGVAQPAIVKRPNGPAWVLRQGQAAIFVSVDAVADRLAIESPLVRVPVTQRVPLLRALLELNATREGMARFCLRDQAVVLRYSERPERCPPPTLLAGFQDVVASAELWTERLALGYDAEAVLPRSTGPGPSTPPAWELVGEPIVLMVPGGQEPLALPAEALLPALEGVILEEAEFTIGPTLEAAPISESTGSEQALTGLLRLAVSRWEPLKIAHPELITIVARAAVFLAWQRHREDCPGAVALLLERVSPLLAQVSAAKLVRGLLERVSSGAGAPPLPLEPTFHEVVERGAHYDPAPLPILPKLSEAAEQKALAMSLLTQLRRLPEQAELRELVAVGALAELLARGSFPERIGSRLYGEIELAQALNGEHARRLEQILERVSQ
ncbi:MAG: hypothetical protein IPG45_13405 [Deltaproteobacteria bacterium]|nr:hypothetical protein [Deltaproteobacteria bacterium]